MIQNFHLVTLATSTSFWLSRPSRTIQYWCIFLILQRNCIEFALNAKPVRRYIPKNPIQYKLWAFVTSPIFEYTIFVMILVNTLSLAMKFYQQPELYTQFLDILNVIFTVFFTMEFVFKLGAFRFKVCPTFPFKKMDSLLFLNWFKSTSFQPNFLQEQPI